MGCPLWMTFLESHSQKCLWGFKQYIESIWVRNVPESAFMINPWVSGIRTEANQDIKWTRRVSGSQCVLIRNDAERFLEHSQLLLSDAVKWLCEYNWHGSKAPHGWRVFVTCRQCSTSPASGLPVTLSASSATDLRAVEQNECVPAHRIGSADAVSSLTLRSAGLPTSGRHTPSHGALRRCRSHRKGGWVWESCNYSVSLSQALCLSVTEAAALAHSMLRERSGARR